MTSPSPPPAGPIQASHRTAPAPAPARRADVRPGMARPLASGPSKRRWVIPIVVLLAAFVLLAVVTAFLPASVETTADSVTNARANGAKAVAQVLRANGVTVSQVTALDGALAAARPGTTLALVVSDQLSTDTLNRLDDVQADLVLIVSSPGSGSTPYDTVLSLTGERVAIGPGVTDTASQPANCRDADATAAQSATPPQTALVLYQGPASGTGDTTWCFSDSTFSTGGYLYADTLLPAHRVTVLAGDQFVRNGAIAQEGNAALALRTLGRHQTLTWYLPGADALAGNDSGGSSLDPMADMWALMPPWAQLVWAVGLAAAAAAAVWRGRRFGPLVPEALPVAVPASEATEGLGRLYRQSGACGHAGAALRAATIGRLATRLGLPVSSSPETVVHRIAEASGREPGALDALLYGPPPGTDEHLLSLATGLQRLESAFGANQAQPTESEHR